MPLTDELGKALGQMLPVVESLATEFGADVEELKIIKHARRVYEKWEKGDLDAQGLLASRIPWKLKKIEHDMEASIAPFGIQGSDISP